MNPDVTKMTPKEFAEWWLSGKERPRYDIAKFLYELLAARDRALLEAAARRAGADRNSPLWGAILGEPRFKPGQLVKRRGVINGFFEWPGDTKGVHQPPNYYEPVIDINGKPVYLPVDEAEA